MQASDPVTSILLVDDEEDIRDVLDIALRDKGYTVYTAQDGKEALEIFEKRRPPVILTDIKMPGMDGIELLKIIKRENPETEVIMITGHGDMGLAVESLKNEATDFITKPINVDALDIALKRARERITVRRQLQAYTENLERLVREKSELQDHLSALGLMIGTISHGLKGLLTGLDGGMYILESGLKSNDEAKRQEGWQIVKTMVGRIRKLVMDILFYAKKREIERQPIEARKFVEQLYDAAVAKIKSRGIEFIHHCPDHDFTISVDPGYLQAALMNIIENAVDACLKDESKDNHRITFTLKDTGNHVIFSIEDNGVGMDKETRDNLFSLFFSSKGRSGTGLGLFVARKIVEQHGGSIEVSSTPGRGSRFVIKLPKNPVNDPETQPSPKATPSGNRNVSS